MNRADYYRLIAQRHELQRLLREVIEFQSMADARLVVQIQADADMRRSIQRRIQQITMQLPYCGADPKGLQIMAQNWARRRSHVEYRCRQRRKDAERYARAVQATKRAA